MIIHYSKIYCTLKHEIKHEVPTTINIAIT